MTSNAVGKASDVAPIPFNQPSMMGDELAYIRDAVESGHSASGGPYSSRVSELLASETGASEVLLTTSCTDALEMTGMMLGIGEGDVVIVPSFTFTSTALAYARAGATIRFCDIDRTTLGLDPEDVEKVLDERVKAIVTVHYAGVPSDVAELGRLAHSVGAALIEDNAHGFFGRHDGRPLGSFGRMSTLSFHETKNFISGEGGALVLNDPDDVERAHVLLDKGTNRQQFLDGAVDKYTWQDVGSSFGMSDLLAAFLYGQLCERDEIRRQRRRVSERYRRCLEPYVERLGITLPVEPPNAEPADHMFYVILPPSIRPMVLAQLKRAGVHATFHYVPLHSSEAGRRFSELERDCPVTDDVSARLIRLPFYNRLDDASIDRVVAEFIAAIEAAGQ